jgi:hypothetical protein
LGERRPAIVRGYGGFQTIERAGRMAMTSWPGGETPAYEIDLLIDAAGSTNAAQKKKRLETLCGWDGGNSVRPEVIRWTANVSYDFLQRPGLRWVCEDLEWGDAVSSDAGGLRNQRATILLALYSVADLEQLKGAEPFPRKRLRKGETLREFAKRTLRDPKRWRDLAALNRDVRGVPRTPEAKAKKAVMLKVPPRETKAARRATARRT